MDIRQPRLCLIGTGTVGRWLLEELGSRADELERRYEFRPVVVGVANAHDGFIHAEQGLHIPTLR